ncbi:glutathione S-transferase C-terminal domain-containing protein-like isoform X2 [Varroa jacobsoni]|uniref:glutathione S-transferase C-terminal domain-containing protein-like isoform X2 n=1 Tax=Varroa jacobsoni TaxID=62625 RepID=UPI000BF6D681|nr:glutathione S-transferase C-terminal domain-containing protein-like isoform X2 [Varroa jacobsoni]
MPWSLSQRDKLLCTLIATRENSGHTVLYLQGSEKSLTLESAMCAYALAFENVLDVVRVVLVRGRGDSAEARKFTLHNNALQKVPIVEEAPEEVRDVELPAVYIQGERRVIAGLCSCLRYILLQNSRVDILGFRAACLAACAQVSLWTSFCERDMPSALLNFPVYSQKMDAQIASWFPQELLLLENHLRIPVRTHNHKHLKQMLQVEELNHDFVEGITLTLSDLLLFFIVHLMFKEMMQRFVFDQTIPLVFKWYHRMLNLNMTKPNLAVFLALRICLKEQSKDTIHSELVVNPHTVLTHNGIEKIRVAQLPLPAMCLYSQSKMNMSLRTRVKHKDASKLLRVLQHCPSLIKENVDFHQLLPWDELPEEVRPESGGLPEKRIQRKREQISNVVNAVISLIDNGSSLTIVDFCSGGGHVAIAVAYLLPNCQIVLVENKYESLHRARARAKTLGLNNVRFCQCNLDRFCGHFDVGVSLHACGEATDLAMDKCLQSGASFVSVPCCYGGISRAFPLHETLTNALKTIQPKDIGDAAVVQEFPNQGPDDTSMYKLLCHFADRNECEEGALCMSIIDSDRTRYITSHGYETQLTNILPLSCTPKNNMIVARKRLAKQEPLTLS